MKTRYNITLFPNCGILAKDVAVLAAMSNGKNYITISELETYCKVEISKYPTINEGVFCNNLGESLTIDKTLYNGETICLCAIDLVEVGELATLQDVLNNAN